MWVLTLKCFPPLTTSFMINSINMMRCIHSAYLCPSLLPFKTGASSPRLEQILVWCGEAWGRGHHTTHTANVAGVYSSLFVGGSGCGRKLGGGGLKIIQRRTGLGTEQTVGKEKGLMDGVWPWASQGPPVLLSAASGSSGWFSSALSSSSSSWFSGTFLGRRVGENSTHAFQHAIISYPTPLLPAWKFSV